MRRFAPLPVAAALVAVAFLPSPAADQASKPALAAKLDAVLDGPDYKHATWAVLVCDARTGDVVYARNPDALVAPASVTKLFTCAAALIAVGPDATTETAVHQRGLLFKGTLVGDLVLVAGGDLMLGGRADPSGKTVFKDKDHTYANSGLSEAELTDTDPLAGLDALAKQVKAAGVRRVDGEVLIDDRLFARAKGSGSGPDAVSPVVVNDNVVDLTITPGPAEGEPAKVTARPETAFVQVDAVVGTGPAGSPPEITLTPLGDNRYAVRGKVAKGAKPLVRILPVDDPTLYARGLFVEALRRAGVVANAAVARPTGGALPRPGDYAKLPKVATFTSAPFKDAVAVTLKVSHNLYASTLPCLVAVSKGEKTADAGLREERRILEELGVDVNAVSFGGGAGGAPADFVSPRATVQLLHGMAGRPEWPAYKAGLPVLGVDGTLAETVGADSPAKGKVFAKTGTLIWSDAANERFLLKSKALAGVMTTKAGAELRFALFVNNVPLPKGTGAAREGKVLGKLCEILYEHGP